jgi:hypothetical protein
VTPTLDLLGRERVTITDYKSSDVRDPVRARQRARDSLQLQIYAMGWEAQTGRLPDAVQLHFLESGLVGRGGGAVARARADLAAAAASGPRLRRPPGPPVLRTARSGICPSSVAGSVARARACRDPRDRSTSETRSFGRPRVANASST